MITEKSLTDLTHKINDRFCLRGGGAIVAIPEDDGTLRIADDNSGLVFPPDQIEAVLARLQAEADKPPLPEDWSEADEEDLELGQPDRAYLEFIDLWDELRPMGVEE